MIAPANPLHCDAVFDTKSGPVIFERQTVSPRIVTLLAAWHQIALARLAAAYERYQMIHGQFFGRKLAGAMMAYAGGALALPPLARAQLPRFSPLAADVFLRYYDYERARLHLGKLPAIPSNKYVITYTTVSVW